MAHSSHLEIVMNSLIRAFGFALSFVLLTTFAAAADWPTWRADSNRSASTAEELPSELHLQWSMQKSVLKPAWPEDIRLQFDANYEPIVVGETMYLSSSTNDSVTAYSLKTGQQRWRFFADGPVRFAPLAAKGKIYAAADDGSLYCLNASNGSLLWKYNAAPSDRKVIGNDRLVSVWPIRGGPVLADGKIYFTAGVWPFEGTFLYSVDPETGKLVDIGGTENVSTRQAGSMLKDQSPQGYLVAAGDNLYLPCGRANIYGINRKTGSRLSVRYSSKGLTDYHVVAQDEWLFHGGKIVNVSSNATAPVTAHRAVIDKGVTYFAAKGQATAYDLKNPKLIDSKDRRGEITKIKVPQQLWSFAEEGVTRIHIKAGNRLYGHRDKSVFAIDIPAADGQAKISWKAAVDGTPVAMLAANGHLIVATKEGTLHCFAGQTAEPKTLVDAEPAVPASDSKWSSVTTDILEQTKSKNGYCLVMGVGSGKLIDELVRQSQYQIVAIDPNAQKVEATRSRLDKQGLYGTRVVVRQGDLLSMNFPPYLASLVVSEDLASAGLSRQSQFVQGVFHTLRPYGGVACFALTSTEHGTFATEVAQQKLSRGEVNRSGQLTTLARAGALAGAADWTHEYGDPANTLMSRDKLVKAPLGLLWFGGPSSDGSLFFDRHKWGPSMAVIEGRMFIQGPEVFTAVDVYTGRILWQNKISKGTTPGRRANWEATGFHFVAEKDAIYLAFPDECVRLDPATGEEVETFTLPEEGDQWGRIRIWKDQIIAPVFRKVEGKKALVPAKLVCMNRHTGKVAWSQNSEHGFPMLAIGGDTVFCYEGALRGLFIGADKRRKGGIPEADPVLNIKAYDVISGQELWSNSTDQIATWLAYSEEHDVLLTSNKAGIRARKGAGGDELWTKQATGNGFRGHPENYWDKVIIWNDRLIDQRGPGRSYDLLTGEAMLRNDPITGKAVPWEFTKSGHHCNYAIASEHLMTFRAASAGFCDLESGGTGRLVGFRTGCRNSLIPANGVMNAPNFAFGCSCSYSIFTSLALVNVPEANLWTYGAYKKHEGRISRLGINFGAEGDRKSEDGTMWLDYPNVGGSSPELTLQVGTNKPKAFRLHSAQVKGDSLTWVAASGLKAVSSVKIPLFGGKPPAEITKQAYRVRLYFAEPDNAAAGENVFDVLVEGETALSDFDVVREAGGAKTAIVKDVTVVAESNVLTIVFKPKSGTAMISGIEVIAIDKKD
jgi:outer membrane protein assembly factor BamB